MTLSSRQGHPLDWFGALQRAYMRSADESVLEEAGDVGRLIALTGLPVESVLDLHSRILCEEIAQTPSVSHDSQIVGAVTCLAAVLVAWRVAAEGIGESGESPLVSSRDGVPPVFLRFAIDGRLSRITLDGESDEEAGALPAWADLPSLSALAEALSGASRLAEIRAAIKQCRLASFEMPASIPGQNTLRAVICPFRDGTGLVAIHDVTALLAARTAEVQRRKLESLGQFAGGVAHEINNLLQPIMTIAQLSIEDHAANEDLCHDLGLVLDSARKAADILRDVLIFARQAPPTLQPLPLAAAVHKALAPLRGWLPSGLRLVEDLEACGDETVLGNATELTQVVGNLVHNAIDAMERLGGTVTVSAVPYDVSGVEAARLGLAAGRYLRLSVADQGAGVDPRIVHRIFDPFFTTKDVGKGTGLGLSIVNAILKSWGGSIALRPGGGRTVFDVFLAPSRSRQPSDPGLPPRSPPGG